MRPRSCDLQVVWTKAHAVRRYAGVVHKGLRKGIASREEGEKRSKARVGDSSGEVVLFGPCRHVAHVKKKWRRGASIALPSAR